MISDPADNRSSKRDRLHITYISSSNVQIEIEIEGPMKSKHEKKTHSDMNYLGENLTRLMVIHWSNLARKNPENYYLEVSK